MALYCCPIDFPTVLNVKSPVLLTKSPGGLLPPPISVVVANRKLKVDPGSGSEAGIENVAAAAPIGILIIAGIVDTGLLPGPAVLILVKTFQGPSGLFDNVLILQQLE
jgi:hypothetical protein